VSLPLVAYDTRTRDQRTGAETADRDILAFRAGPALVDSLDDAGFTVTHRYGDWERAPLAAETPEIILVARRR
jgi:hypothetical protein